MRLAVLGTILLTMAWPVAPAAAASDKDIKACKGDIIDVALAACTRIASSRAEIPQMRAIAHMYMGTIWLNKNDYDRAIADFTKALAFDPKFTFMYDRRALARAGKGDYRKAIADYNEALRLDPKFTLSLGGRCRARASYNKENSLALANCNQSLEVQPRDVMSLESRGVVFLKLNRMDDAIFDFNAALAINPKLSEARFGRGLARMKRGELVSGESDIEAAKKIHPAVAEAFAGYGILAGEFVPDVQTQATSAPDVRSDAPLGASMSPASADDQQQAPASDCAHAETHWKAADTLGLAAGYEDHLARFADCSFAGLAKLKLGVLKAK